MSEPICPECGNQMDDINDTGGHICYRADRVRVVPIKIIDQLQAENNQQADFMALAKEEMDALQTGNKRLREALKGLLLSYNKHWIRMPLVDCRDMTPGKIAQTVVDAEQALKGDR